MRVDLTKVVSVGDGDTVVITCRLKRGHDHARLSVWSAAPGFELSPHVFPAQLSASDRDGRPQMVKPLSLTLHELRRKHTIEFVSQEEIDIVIRQEIDVVGDPIAIAKVQAYGKTAASFRRILRNAIRAIRNRTTGHLRTT